MNKDVIKYFFSLQIIITLSLCIHAREQDMVDDEPPEG